MAFVQLHWLAVQPDALAIPAERALRDLSSEKSSCRQTWLGYRGVLSMCCVAMVIMTIMQRDCVTLANCPS